MNKKCGLTESELNSRIGMLKSLDIGDQMELARIIKENNEAIEEYIKNNAQSIVSKGFMNDLRTKRGMR